MDTSFVLPEILFEDDYIVVINKPSNMLSVPGNTGCTEEKRAPKQEEWMKAIRHAGSTCKSDDDGDAINARRYLRMFGNKMNNIPRKEKQFRTFMQRNTKTIDKKDSISGSNININGNNDGVLPSAIILLCGN